MADITAWRIILWFSSGKLEQIDKTFISNFPLLENFFNKINNYEPLTQLDEYRDIIS